MKTSIRKEKMTSFHGKTLPPFSDDQMFEKFVAELWEARHPGSSASFMGRPGQSQSGLDVLLTTQAGAVIGIQCKATTRLTEKTLTEEASKAASHRPLISRFVLATTAPHDVAMVTLAQRLSEENAEKDLFPVAVFGWTELLRLAEPYPEIIRRFFPEFALTEQSSASEIEFGLDQNMSIPMGDTELALFCSETASALKKNPRATLRIVQDEEQRLLRQIRQIDQLGTPTTEQRLERSNLEALLSRIGPRLRRFETTIPLLLTNETIRSPWLIGPDWHGTAAVLRRLCMYVLRPSLSRPEGVLTVKMRSPTNSSILAYLDLEGEDEKAFLSRNPSFTPNYFLGFVPDLGHDLGIKYALPAGIEALVRYSAGFEVDLGDLRKAGEFSIYNWMLEPA